MVYAYAGNAQEKNTWIEKFDTRTHTHTHVRTRVKAHTKNFSPILIFIVYAYKRIKLAVRTFEKFFHAGISAS